jgi:hypothetical protein
MLNFYIFKLVRLPPGHVSLGSMATNALTWWLSSALDSRHCHSYTSYCRVPQNPSYPPRSAFTKPIIEAASSTVPAFSYSMVPAACAETATSEAPALAVAASEAKLLAEVMPSLAATRRAHMVVLLLPLTSSSERSFL